MCHGASYVGGMLSAQSPRLAESEGRTIRVEVSGVLIDLGLSDAVLENYDESYRSR